MYKPQYFKIIDHHYLKNDWAVYRTRKNNSNALYLILTYGMEKNKETLDNTNWLKTFTINDMNKLAKNVYKSVELSEEDVFLLKL